MTAASPLRLRHVAHPLDTGRNAHRGWTEREWPSIGGLYRTIPREPFAMAADSIRLDDIWVHLADFTAQRWVRDAAIIAANDPATLHVLITLAGSASGRFGRRPFLSGPGSVHFVDMSQDSNHESSASRSLLITVPRAVATAAGLDVAALHGVVMRSAAGDMIAAHLVRLFETAGSYKVSDAPVLARTILDMLVLTVASATPESASDVRKAAAAQTAREMIVDQLESPDLTIAHLCRALGISRTTLHRLFEEEGGVLAYIRNCRLAAVHKLLSDPNEPALLLDLAHRFNFSDAAHLTRSFRQRFHVTPSTFRQQVRSLTDG